MIECQTGIMVNPRYVISLREHEGSVIIYTLRNEVYKSKTPMAEIAKMVDRANRIVQELVVNNPPFSADAVEVDLDGE